MFLDLTTKSVDSIYKLPWAHSAAPVTCAAPGRASLDPGPKRAAHLDARVLDVAPPVRRQPAILLYRAAHLTRALHRRVRQRRRQRQRRVPDIPLPYSHLVYIRSG